MSQTESTIFQYPDSLIILYAREPVKGKVKTRLISKLGEVAATELYAQLLDFIFACVIESKLAPLEISITPESNHAYFLAKKAHDDFQISMQTGNNLGDRMYKSILSALEKYSKVILIGSDCPFISSEVLHQAIIALDTHDMVFSPASDGGYVLVGAKQPFPQVFDKIQWGSTQVMQQTRKALSAHGISWKELSELHDIDDENDLKYLSELKSFNCP